MAKLSYREIEGASGRRYRFEHPTPEQLKPGVKFPGIYAMISIEKDVLCGVKRVAFTKDLPRLPHITHAPDMILWGATHYVLRETDDEREAAAIVADIIALHQPVGNRE